MIRTGTVPFNLDAGCRAWSGGAGLMTIRHIGATIMNDKPETTMYKGWRVTMLPNRVAMGTVTEAGAQQSTVQWVNGNVVNVPNAWLMRITEGEFERRRVNGGVGGASMPPEATRARTPERAAAEEGMRKGEAARSGTAVADDHRPRVSAPKAHGGLGRAPRPPVAPAKDDLGARLNALGPAEIKALGKRNGVWKDMYDELPNDGLRRMNVGNRLRAMVKRGETVKW